MTTLHLKKSIGRSSLRLGLHLIPLLLACFALLPSVQATPDPGVIGGGNSNAADGFGALNATVSGINNSGFGANALHNLTSGNNNAAQGNSALFTLTAGNKNTALGVLALRLNLSGDDNTAVGYRALNVNTSDFNTAVGSVALAKNTGGVNNAAVGFQALFSNTGGSHNTAVGLQALLSNIAGDGNTAVGVGALAFTTGNHNIAIGMEAGDALTSGDSNIDIGNVGTAGESNTIRIGLQGTQTATFIAGISGASVTGGQAVLIDANGKLGTVTPPSSARFKNEIKPMGKASDAILALKPVTFRYKQDIDPTGAPQFGLIAEEVEKVDPDLVLRNAKGEIESVRYEAVNAMLLNEFLKEHRKVEKLEAALAAVNERLKAQDAKIDKVNAKVELTKPAPQMAVNDQ